MDVWVNALKGIAFSVFGRNSHGEMWTLVVICAVLFLYIYGRMFGGFSGKIVRSLTSIIIGILIMAFAAVFVQLHVDRNSLIEIGATVMAFFLVVLPVTEAMEKSTYMKSLGVWLLCLLAVALVLYLEPPIYRSMMTGSFEAGFDGFF